MPDQPTDFERSFAARLRGHLDAAVGEVDPSAIAASVAAEAERVRPVVPTRVRWMATPPVTTRWRPVAAVAAVVALALTGVLVAGALDEPSPSPRPSSTAAAVHPSVNPSGLPTSAPPSPEPTDAPGLRRLAANGLLAWTADRSIQLVEPDGSGLRSIDPFNGWELNPVWSPFGDWIAFVVPGDHAALARVRADGSGAELLTGPDVNVAGAPVWSPDGSWLASTVLANGDEYETVVVHVATRRVVALGSGVDPDWAPDSRRVVLVQGPPGGTWLAIASLDGGVTPLTSGHVDYEPDWSPVEDTILFTRAPQRANRTVVMAVSATGGAPREAIPALDGASDERAGWDPFGEWIAFDRSTDAGVDKEGHIATARGLALRQPVAGFRWIGPTWSPDGRLLLAVASGRNFGGFVEWTTLNVTTGERGTLAQMQQPPGGLTAVSWQPLRYAVDCGPLDEVECRDQAIATVAAGLSHHPGKRVLSIRFETECGTYTLDFTDGTGVGADIDCVRP